MRFLTVTAFVAWLLLGSTPLSAQPSDRIAAEGGDIIITPILHSSVQIEHAGTVVHIDPWSAGDLSEAKPADLILVTDDPGHHLDPEAIAQLRKPGATVVLTVAAHAQFGAGEVLVVGMGGETRTAFMGDIMTTHLLAKGAAGAVLDGAVSDAAAISGIPFPVFCTGNAATPLTSHRIVVELDCPIDCAGVPVLPGDVIMGDANGVVAIPGQIASELAETCAERELLEEFVIERVRGGAPLAGTYPPDEATLAAFRDWRSETGR